MCGHSAYQQDIYPDRNDLLKYIQIILLLTVLFLLIFFNISSKKRMVLFCFNNPFNYNFNYSFNHNPFCFHCRCFKANNQCLIVKKKTCVRIEVIKKNTSKLTQGSHHRVSEAMISFIQEICSLFMLNTSQLKTPNIRISKCFLCLKYLQRPSFYSLPCIPIQTTLLDSSQKAPLGEYTSRKCIFLQ